MPKEIKPELSDGVNTLAVQTIRLFDELSAAELIKFQKSLGEGGVKKVRSNAAGLKHCLMLIGFSYVEAIKQARDSQVKKTKPLPGQQTLL